jgi:ketosteroid isomerase-like protein
MPPTPTEPQTSPVERSSKRARRFIEALQRAEETGRAEDLVALFRDDAELRSLVHDEPRHGSDGARRFWHEYLASFQEVRSRFERVREADDLVVLEWTTDATLRNGQDVTYQGVSLVELAGDRVVRFRTYYDSAALAGRHRPPRATH